jgi:hypothetical protein
VLGSPTLALVNLEGRTLARATPEFFHRRLVKLKALRPEDRVGGQPPTAMYASTIGCRRTMAESTIMIEKSHNRRISPPVSARVARFEESRRKARCGALFDLAARSRAA